MRKVIAGLLVVVGLVVTVYGWRMKGMTVSRDEVRMRTETKYRTESTTHSTKGRNATIGAGVGGIGAGIGAAIIGGIGVVVCGTGFGVPAGIGLIAGAAALGAGGGAVAGAATGKSETVTCQVPYTVEVPYTVTITEPKRTPTQISAVLGIGVGMAFVGIWGGRRRSVVAEASAPDHEESTVVAG